MVDRSSSEFQSYLDLYENTSLLELGAMADDVRRRLHPDNTVTYIVDRNINYTNVCVADCKFCAFYRRPKSKDDTYGDGQPETDQHRPSANDGVSPVSKPGRDHPGAEIAKQDTGQPAGHRQHDRLHQKLRGNVSSFGAQCATDTDFARALRYGGQHDVHDSDATDQQADSRNEPKKNL